MGTLVVQSKGGVIDVTKVLANPALKVGCYLVASKTSTFSTPKRDIRARNAHGVQNGYLKEKQRSTRLRAVRGGGWRRERRLVGLREGHHVAVWVAGAECGSGVCKGIGGGNCGTELETLAEFENGREWFRGRAPSFLMISEFRRGFSRGLWGPGPVFRRNLIVVRCNAPLLSGCHCA